MRNKVIHIIFIAIATVVFTSCYEEYLIVSSDYKSPVITNDSSQIFFFHFLEVAQPPKGITRFPDGGRHKIIYDNVSLYSFDLRSKRLNKIKDFGDIPFLNIEHISVQENNIVFSLSPLMGWHWIKAHKSDSALTAIFDQYVVFYKYNFTTQKLNRFVYNGFYPEISQDENQIIYLKRDTASLSIWYLDVDHDINQQIVTINSDSPFKPIKWQTESIINYKYAKNIYEYNLQNQTSRKVDYDVNFYPSEISIKEVRKLTSGITYKDWGFDLSKYWNKSKKVFIRDIVELNGNFNYRKAIIQHLSNGLTNKEVEGILNKMDRYQNSLEGFKKSEYELYSKETKDLLKALLN